MDLSVPYYIPLIAHTLCVIVLFVDLLYYQREDAKSATMWIMSILLFPFIGGIFYLLFGHKFKWPIEKRLANALNRLKRMNIKRYQMRPLSDREEETLYNKMFNNLGHREYRRASNSIKLLHDGTETYPRMVEVIRQAKHHIHLQSYIIKDDSFTHDLFDLLLEKAQSGVKVRVLYDSLGSFFSVMKGFFRSYSNRSPNFVIRPFSKWMILTPWRLQHRNHRKILIVDGQIAFAGGMNLFIENMKRHNVKPQVKDLHAQLQGPVIYDMQYQFFRDWFFAGDEHIDDNQKNLYFPDIQPAGSSIIRVIGSGPGQHEFGVENAFNILVNSAKSHIWIMTPYFIPNTSFLQSLRLARMRGVEIRIILPEKADNFLTTNATKVIYSTLIRKRIRIFEKGGSFMHSKAMVVDNNVVMMGSPNCDVRSFSLNYETAFVVECPVFNNHLRRHFREEMKKSTEITIATLLQKRWYQRIWEMFCYLFSPIL